MSTLKELQLANPIGTKFHLSTAVNKQEYVYFDGVYWRNHTGLLWSLMPADCANWEIYKEPRTFTRYISLYQDGSVLVVTEKKSMEAPSLACVKVTLTEGVFDE